MVVFLARFARVVLFAAGYRLAGAMDRMHRNLLTPREDIYTGKE